MKGYRTTRYRCCECGRNIFQSKAKHQCNGIFKNPDNWKKVSVKIQSA